MKRRQLVTLGIGSLLSAVAGCVDTESAVGSEPSERNHTNEESTDVGDEPGGTAATTDRCMDDVHAVVLNRSDIPDEVTVVDLSAAQFDHRSTVRRTIEMAADTANGNGGVTVCREEYEDLRDTVGQRSETTDSDREQRHPGTMYFDHDGTVAKVVLEAND